MTRFSGKWKWALRVLLILIVLFSLLVVAAIWGRVRAKTPVGLQIVQVLDRTGKPSPLAIWYPTKASASITMLGPVVMEAATNAPLLAGPQPLVVISHGNGGALVSHIDLAMDLVDAGYIVAAPMHLGDNFADQSAVSDLNFFQDRTQQLRDALDFLLKNWSGRGNIDSNRIGAYGFSAGGFTVLAAAGARPDLTVLPKHCARTQEFACDVLRAVNSPLMQVAPLEASREFVADQRIRAAIVAAPGLGFTFSTDGMHDVRIPIQLWSGDRDEKVPYDTNGKLVAAALGNAADLRLVPGAGHFAFLAPCGALLRSELCTDPGQFDRKAFHRQMNAEVVRFFDKNLR